MKAPRSTDFTSAETIRSAVSGCQILLVEDHPFHASLISEVLTRAHVQVTIADNGEQALEQLKQQAFDLVLMDIQMPIMDGYEATRQIRSQEQYAELPIIALTASNNAEDVEQISEVGMNDHACKPIEANALFSLVYSWLPDSKLASDASGSHDLPTLQTQSATETSQSSQHLNRTKVEAYASSTQLLENLLATFMQTCVKDIMQLKKAVKSEQPEAIKEAAHSIQGVIDFMGAETLYNIAKQLEDQAQLLSPEETQSLCQKLVEGYQQLIKEVREWQGEL